MKKLSPIYRALCLFWAVFMALPPSIFADSRVTSFTYDSQNRLSSKTAFVGTLFYTYDSNGRVASVSSSTLNGISLQYQYDALGRLTNVIDLRLTGLARSNTSYAFDADNGRIGCVLPNGVSSSYSFNSVGRLTNETVSLSGVLLANFSYKLGLTGNWTNLTETINGTNRVYIWRYDSLYRLTNETITASAGPTGQLSYLYDLVGNRLSRSGNLGPLGPASYGYDANDWLTNDTYDANGNTVASSGKTYGYDIENHLTSLNGGTVTISYNAVGARVSKTVGSVTTLYLIDDNNPTGYPQVVEESTVIEGVTNLSRVYAYGLGLISQRQPGISTNFFVPDGHGSTRLLTDGAGNIVNTFVYDAFGNLIASNAAPQTAHLYCGEEWDTDLGMYYLRSRYYNPATGRFWTRDVHEGDPFNPQSFHKYLYSLNDPINGMDPSGRMTMTLTELTVVAGLALILATMCMRHTQFIEHRQAFPHLVGLCRIRGHTRQRRKGRPNRNSRPNRNRSSRQSWTSCRLRRTVIQEITDFSFTIMTIVTQYILSTDCGLELG